MGIGRKRAQRASLKRKFMTAQGGKCWLCGLLMKVDVAPTDPEYATWDHVLPVSAGGGNKQDNLILAHRKCNLKRGNREDFKSCRDSED